MSRSSLLIATSLLALSACQPATEATEDVIAEAPPVEAAKAVEEVDTVNAEMAETASADTVMAAADAEDHAHDEVEKVAEEAHHDHDHDHDHDHSHDHDHDHDHASPGGEAHVHGKADLAISLEGSALSVSLISPLDNFGLPESLTSVENEATYLNGVIALVGGDCGLDQSDLEIRNRGDHGNMAIDLTYTCAEIDTLEAIDVVAFSNFPGFEEVDAVVLTDSDQMAETLTASQSRLDLG
ncbi:MAG: DUF2796 domain-containing protein [Pseudomonadota bacterium]